MSPHSRIAMLVLATSCAIWGCAASDDGGPRDAAGNDRASPSGTEGNGTSDAADTALDGFTDSTSPAQLGEGVEATASDYETGTRDATVPDPNAGDAAWGDADVDAAWADAAIDADARDDEGDTTSGDVVDVGDSNGGETADGETGGADVGISDALDDETNALVDAAGDDGHEDGPGTDGDAQTCTRGQTAACGRGTAGINCGVWTGTAFGAETAWQPSANAFSDTNGWGSAASYHDTIRFPDVNGDGFADTCGRGIGGINCALSGGSSFGSATVWQGAATAFSDANGWGSSPSYYTTIEFPDVNGDRMSDACGRGIAGIYCAISTGTAFRSETLWQPSFSDANQWNASASYYGTIQFPDVDGDGRADVCGRGVAGIYCAVSSGASFGGETLWGSDFSDSNGWGSSPAYYSTIQFPDVDGDGRADVCGRGVAGIYCAISSGIAFGTSTLWAAAFSDANGWNASPSYYSTIQFPDVNGDGKADVCGRGISGLNCALSNGTKFGAVSVWQTAATAFSDANGWNMSASYYATILFPDVDGDGKADTCGRGVQGLWCGISDGSTFGTAILRQASATAFSDANMWGSSDSYWGTIQFPVVSAGTCTPGIRPTPLLRPAQRFDL